MEANAGIWWQGTLQAVPLQQGLAQQRGIKRHADKVGEHSRQYGTLPGIALHAAPWLQGFFLLLCAVKRQGYRVICLSVPADLLLATPTFKQKCASTARRSPSQHVALAAQPAAQRQQQYTCRHTQASLPAS